MTTPPRIPSLSTRTQYNTIAVLCIVIGGTSALLGQPIETWGPFLTGGLTIVGRGDK